MIFEQETKNGRIGKIMKRGWNHVRGQRVYFLKFNYILKGLKWEVAYSSTQQKNPTDGKTQQPKNPLKNQKPNRKIEIYI